MIKNNLKHPVQNEILKKSMVSVKFIVIVATFPVVAVY